MSEDMRIIQGHPVDISSPEIAKANIESLNMEWHQKQLDAIQEMAKKIGYGFAKADTADYLLPDARVCIEYALADARVSGLYPKTNTTEHFRTVRGWIDDGFIPRLLDDILDNLEIDSGIRLKFLIPTDVYALARERERVGLLLAPENDPANYPPPIPIPLESTETA